MSNPFSRKDQLAASLVEPSGLPAVELLDAQALNDENNKWNHQSEDDSYSTAWTDEFSQSMAPHMTGRNVLLMQKYGTGKQPKIGALVVIEDKKGRMVHQLIKMAPGYIKTKGVGNDYDDGWIPTGNMKYVVHRILKAKPNDVAEKLVEPDAGTP